MDDDGNVLLSDRPGLGCELNWDYINDHRIVR
jgi:L-alanine-DL-glutamate epimerase-like enolase superfamily enzyme